MAPSLFFYDGTVLIRAVWLEGRSDSVSCLIEGIG